MTAKLYALIPTANTTHNNLAGRNDADAHPVSSITDLQTTLDAKIEASNLIAGANVTLDKAGNDVTINSTASGGTSIHNELLQRDANDAHPIASITNLQAELDSKLSTLSFEDKYADTIKRWENLGGSYNAGTELFTYGSLTDLTLCQILDTLQKNIMLIYQVNYRSAFHDGFSPRLFINGMVINSSITPTIKPRLQNTFFDSNLEMADFNGIAADCDGTFWNCSNFRILKNLRISTANDYTFSNNISLELFESVQVLAIDLNIGDSLGFTFQGMANLLNDWLNSGTAVTLTVHADIFDKIYNNANPDYAVWNPLDTIATSKNITIGV